MYTKNLSPLSLVENSLSKYQIEWQVVKMKIKINKNSQTSFLKHFWQLDGNKMSIKIKLDLLLSEKISSPKYERKITYFPDYLYNNKLHSFFCLKTTFFYFYC
jgi:hypothetical protein